MKSANEEGVSAQEQDELDQATMTAPTCKGGIKNRKIVQYLENFVYPEVKLALGEFIHTIHDNGDLERYWNTIEKKCYSARKAVARLEKLKKKLEMGSDYEGSDDEHEASRRMKRE